MKTLTQSDSQQPKLDDVEITLTGTACSSDPDTGIREILIINATYGTGEMVAKGELCPDEYRVFKPFLTRGVDPIIGRTVGTKEQQRICTLDPEHPVCTEPTSLDMRHHYALTCDQILKLASIVSKLEKNAGSPVEIEWAFDERSGRFMILKTDNLQSSAPAKNDPIFRHELQADNAHPLLEGVALGADICHGEVTIVKDLADAENFPENHILVTDSVDDEWLPVLEKAKGLITNQGSRATRAARLCRSFDIPAILGTINATRILKDGQSVTLDCSHSEHGTVYRYHIPFQRQLISTEDLPETQIKRLLSVSGPDIAKQWWQLPCEGFGMAKIEDIITRDIQIHPMALVRYDKIEDNDLRLKIDKLTAAYDDRCEYFIDHLARGIASMAAVAYPDPIVVRFSDFTSEQYSGLLERGLFEPLEPNPKLGLRGVARYLSEHYREAFEMECQAMKRARDEMGFTNISVAIPFCRSLRGAREVLEILTQNGLNRGDEGLDFHLIAEVPSNIILAQEFMRLFDRLDINLDTLTQLILSVDPDDNVAVGAFDHADLAVMTALSTLVDEAHCSGSQVTVFGMREDHRPELMNYLIGAGIDAFAFEPENFVRGSLQIAGAEERDDSPIPTNPNAA